MNPEKKNIQLFNALFDMRVRHLVDDFKDYRKILLEQIFASTSEVLKPDKEFMVDMAEDGFVKALSLFAKDRKDKQSAEVDIMKQVSDILGEDIDDD